jgi:uncharacterized lipoprotein
MIVRKLLLLAMVGGLLSACSTWRVHQEQAGDAARTAAAPAFKPLTANPKAQSANANPNTSQRVH